MEDFGRIPERTIPTAGELSWFQRYYPRIAFLMASTVGLVAGSYIAFILGPDIVEMQVSGIMLMILMPLGALFMLLLLTAELQRKAWPVHLYRDGVQFHLFTFDRMIRHTEFVPVSNIAKVMVIHLIDTRPNRPDSGLPYLKFITTRKSEYMAGQRAEHDVEQALEYIRKEWPTVQVVEENISNVDGRRVAMPAPAVKAPGPAKARKIPVQPSYAPVPPVAYEPRMAQPSYQAPVPPAPTMSFCPSCGAGVVSGARFCPACGHQFGPSVQCRESIAGGGKSTQVAFLLSLLPGLVGFLGFGHLYIRRYAKGAFLLVIGFIFAGLGLGSILLMSDPAYAGSAATLVMVLFFNLLFLMMLVYSVIDARKGAAQFNMGTR